MGEFEGGVLLKREATASTYDLLLRRAREEGRVGGKHSCPVCGMRFHREEEALECCKHFLQQGSR